MDAGLFIGSLVLDSDRVVDGVDPLALVCVVVGELFCSGVDIDAVHSVDLGWTVLQPDVWRAWQRRRPAEGAGAL